MVFYEWNPIDDIELSKQLFPSLVKPTLKSLILRSDKIGDAVLRDVAAKILEAPEIKLKYLDLYDNNLTHESIPTLKELLLANKPLEHL